MNFLIMNLFIISIMLMINMQMNIKTIHPLNLNLLIIMITLMSSINLSLQTLSSWYSFMIFMIMISGLMIIFMYFMNFSINEYSIMNLKNLYNLNMKLSLTLFMTITLKNYILSIQIFNKNFMNSMLNFPLSMNKSILYFSMKIINHQPIFLIMYLLIFLIIISYMCQMKKLTLRQMNI